MPNSSKHAKKPTYLHGDLSLHIIEARHLPNMDIFSEHFRRCIPCSKDTNDDVLEGARKDKKDRPHMKITINNPYVTVLVSQVTVARTHVVKNAQNPFWDEKFEICLAHPVVEHLEFQLKDNDVFGAEIIGSVRIPVEDIVSGVRISGWFSILGSSGKPTKEGSALRVDIRFVPFEMNSVYRDGIAGDPGHNGVKDAYFPVRKGSGVRLYQDAHVPEGLLPDIELDGGKFFSHGKCWEDICYAISEAHHLIYIVGWSVFHKIKLVREPTRPLPRGGDLTLGELLKYKSQEGVRVLLLVWDDKTSHDKLFIETAGVMQTHDEEIRKFFKRSSVTCVLSPRYASNKHSFIRQQVIGSVFTHHQKCLLVDTQAPGNNRKITAFIGGLDLCDGRYDTPEHRLFRDLDTVYKDDYHQPTYPAGTMAPREPWHDLHCRIDGPAAYDILINFEQRWKKASKWKEFTLCVKKVSHTQDDALIKVERISWILSPPLSTSRDGVTDVPKDDPEVWVCSEEDPENWHVQIFRSIDSGSVKGFPRYVHEAETMNLNTDKDLVIERSIQTAYVQAIRSAQHFIYIENQYFIGSSYAWPSYKNAGADNLIPMELALKIASKIRARERFSVYIVVPMWPEGNPKDATVQEILYWQGQTMQMMYHVIANELNTMHIDDVSPQDYLNFYCLGNREDIQIKTAKEGNQVDGNSVTVSDSQKFQRFMIYVHSKGMIVDDEYVILGSANINQRSMAGTKDTEIAMGAYQPHHTWARKNRHPRGQIYGYRNSLWAEHLGKLEIFFEEPNTLECVRRVNEIAKDNWKRFTADEFSLLQGHLLKYPVHVGEDGEVSPLPGHEEFPDLGGRVLGAYSTAIPDVLTT